MSRKEIKKRVRKGDRLYNNEHITLLINMVMKDGKRHKAANIVYTAIDEVLASKKIPFETAEEKQEKVNEVIDKVIEMAGPSVEVVSKRFGGANYMVPRQVPHSKRIAYAFRWMIGFAQNAKRGKSMIEKLAKEMVDIMDGMGSTIGKR